MLTLDSLMLREGDFRLSADWSVPAGARVAVVGPSGAGKSTLLDTIAGFRRPQRGRILWQDIDLVPLPPMDRPIGLLFQENNLFPHLDLTRNLSLALDPSGRGPDTARRARIESALQEVGLAGDSARRPGQLSGGQQSRAALARVLLQGRPILALDEPFAALGPALKSEMLDLVRQVGDRIGALVLMISHDPNDARRFADLTILVADGVAHPPVRTETLFADPPLSLRAYLGL